MRSASLVVTCTAHNLDYLRRLCPGLPPDRIQLVYHGVDMRGFTRGEAPDDRPPLIVAAGRFVAKKGFDRLVAACALLRDRGLAFQCTVAGDGPLRASLAEAIERARLENVVHLPGWLSQAALSSALGRATALVVPSRIADRGDRDGIPNVVLEAMAAGLPIVATNVSGIPEAVIDRATGLLVPPDDPAALAAALQKVIEDRQAARELGDAGRRRALDLFDLDGSSKRLAALFGERATVASPF
jgi:glycosyltransferase involved in cell wall biosynthesis